MYDKYARHPYANHITVLKTHIQNWDVQSYMYELLYRQLIESFCDIDSRAPDWMYYNYYKLYIAWKIVARAHGTLPTLLKYGYRITG